jgi:hypothetical protein
MNATNRPLNWALIILTLFLLAINVNVSAQTCTPGKDKTRLIYVNGVYNNDPGDARETLLSLGIALAREGEPPLPSEAFWNPGDGVVEDPLEAMVSQTWSARGTPFVDAILAVVSPGAAANAINEQIKASARHRKVVEEFKARLMTLITQGDKILIVAHSQGNIVVNDALRDLRQASVSLDSVGVVGLASPDTSEAPIKGLYITSSKDPVINFTNTVVHSLPSNFATDVALSGIQNHYVVEGYLNPSIANQSGQTIRGKVVDSVRLAKEALESCGLALVLTPPSASVKLGDSYQFTVVSTSPGRDNATAPPPSISIQPQPGLFEVTSLSTNQGVATFSIRGLTVSTFKFTVHNDLEKTDMIGELTVTSNIDAPQHPPAWDATFRITACDAVRTFGSGYPCNGHGGHGFGSWTTGFFWVADSAGLTNNMVYKWQINDGTFTSYEYKSIPFEFDRTAEFDIPVRHLTPDFVYQYRADEQSAYTVKDWKGYDEINNIHFIVTKRTPASLEGTFSGSNTYYRYDDSQFASIFSHLETARAHFSGTWVAGRGRLPVITGASSDGCGYISITNQWVAYRLDATGFTQGVGPPCTVVLGPR